MASQQRKYGQPAHGWYSHPDHSRYRHRLYGHIVGIGDFKLIENGISVGANKLMMARSSGARSVVGYNYMDWRRHEKPTAAEAAYIAALRRVLIDNRDLPADRLFRSGAEWRICPDPFAGS